MGLFIVRNRPVDPPFPDLYPVLYTWKRRTNAMITINVLLSGRLKLDGYGRGKSESSDGTFLLALPEKSKVQQAIRGMGVPSSKVAMTMLNGRNCERATKLKTGDRVILIPSDVAALWRYLGAMNMNRETVLDF
jgi:hypothetical protein